MGAVWCAAQHFGGDCCTVAYRAPTRWLLSGGGFLSDAVIAQSSARCQPVRETDGAAPARLAGHILGTSGIVHALRVLMKAPWSQPVDVSGPFLNSAYASAARVRIRVLPICRYTTSAHCYLCSSVVVCLQVVTNDTMVRAAHTATTMHAASRPAAASCACDVWPQLLMLSPCRSRR